MNRSELRAAVAQKIAANASKVNASQALKDVAAGLANGTIGLVERTLYVAGEITGNSTEIFKQIEGSTRREGLTNFAGRMLGDSENAVLTDVTVLYGNTTVAGDVDVRTVVFGNAAIDNHLLNGDVACKSGSAIAFEQPVSVLHNPNTTRTNDELYFPLGDLPIIESKDEIALDFELPAVGSLSAEANEKHWVKVMMKAFVTYKK